MSPVGKPIGKHDYSGCVIDNLTDGSCMSNGDT